MAFSLESISKGRAKKAPRLIVLGVEGVGKSTFASKAENPIFIPMKGEQGIDEIDAHKFPPVATYADITSAIGTLYQDDHPYKTAVIDSSSALEPIIWAETCRVAGVDSVEKVGGGFGKGYTEALKYWNELTEGLDALREERGMTIILIGHVVTGEFNDPEADPYTTYQFDVQKKAAAKLYRWADAVLFANFKRAVVQKSEAGFNKKTSRGIGTGQRVLYTEKRPAHPGKNRYHLPYELALSWSELRAGIDKAQATGIPDEQAA